MERLYQWKYLGKAEWMLQYKHSSLQRQLAHSYVNMPASVKAGYTDKFLPNQ